MTAASGQHTYGCADCCCTLARVVEAVVVVDMVTACNAVCWNRLPYLQWHFKSIALAVEIIAGAMLHI
jgi:hypothetical protein